MSDMVCSVLVYVAIIAVSLLMLNKKQYRVQKILKYLGELGGVYKGLKDACLWKKYFCNTMIVLIVFQMELIQEFASHKAVVHSPTTTVLL